MTHPKPKNSPLQKFLILSVLLIVVLAVSWVSYFLATFNLNDYRRQAEEHLEAVLSAPVQIGQLHYNFHETNIALKIDGLEIGSKETPLQLRAPKVLLSLAWQGLLAQDIRFTELTLEKPEVYVRPKDKPDARSRETATPDRSVGLALLESLHINDLEIRDGSLSIEQGIFRQHIRLTDIEGELANIRLGEASEVILNGDLTLADQSQKSRLQLQGETTLNIAEDKTLVPDLDLSLDIKALDLNNLVQSFSENLGSSSLNGVANLNLLVNGEVNKLAFQLGLSSKQINFIPGNSYTTPVSLQNLFIQGQLFSHEDSYIADNLSLQLDESRLAGKAKLLTSTQPATLEATIYQSDLSVAQLLQWLPDKISLREKLKKSGTIKLEHAHFALQLPKEGSGLQWQLDSLKGEVLNLAATNSEANPFVLESLPVEIDNSKWTIINGRAQWGTQQIVLTGEGSLSPEEMAISTLDISGTLDSTVLLNEWELLELPIDVTGRIPVKAHLEGALDQLTIDIHGDMSDFNLSYAGKMRIAPKADDSLSLHGTLTPELFTLDHGALKWSLSKGHISGAYPLGNPDKLAINALLTINDLTELAATIPLLEKMKLLGQADLSLELSGNPAENLPEMTLTLRDAGLTPTRHIAELNRINGRVQITPGGLVAERLQVYMGDSPFSVKAQLIDFASPVLDLHVLGTSVRAQDVVFSSETAMLRDIEGHLYIDKNGLLFNQVGVKLDGGTDAEVNGTISFHKPYQVQLDIASEYAKIGEVVELWSGARKKSSSPPKDTSTEKPRPKTTVTINAEAKSGDLYGMKFQNASGVITPRRNQLSIHPLDFSVGEGYCNAQVIVDFPADNPSLLRISGHAEDVDALEVYRELLNQENIVRGKLRGDFYLTGEIGSNYLPSSYGEFSVQVNQGVLHKFQVLSKVFSLLNVSQIFALKLPDMATEGMPFDSLSGNFHLDKGVLKSDDLKIMSEAMNQGYVGQLDLVKKEIDLKLQVHPLGTVDKIVSRIPIAGWLLTGDNKAFLTAYFSATGKLDDVSVNVMPLDTLSDQTIGLLERTLGLPFKLMEDPQILWGGDASEE